jgi:hypothetical protein
MAGTSIFGEPIAAPARSRDQAGPTRTYPYQGLFGMKLGGPRMGGNPRAERMQASLG